MRISQRIFFWPIILGSIFCVAPVYADACQDNPEASVACILFNGPQPENYDGFLGQMKVYQEVSLPACILTPMTSVGLSNEAVEGAIKNGNMQLGNNTIYFYQCLDKQCYQSEPVGNVTINIQKSKTRGQYVANPYQSVINYKDNGVKCNFSSPTKLNIKSVM